MGFKEPSEQQVRWHTLTLCLHSFRERAVSLYLALVLFVLFLLPSPAAAGSKTMPILQSVPDSLPVSQLYPLIHFLTAYWLPAVAEQQDARPTTILIDLNCRRLMLFSGRKLVFSRPVAVGKPETPTPVGNWRIKRKAMNWGNGFGTRWLGLDVPWGIYGIHGTNKPYSIGGYESAGCIRMFNADVENLYSLVHTGTPVIIVGKLLRGPRVMRRGDCGSDVIEVQRVLKRQGFYAGPLDGNFGWAMRAAVERFREAHGLPPDDAVDDPVYRLLGL